MRWQESYSDITVEHQEESVWQEVFYQFMQSNESRYSSSRDTNEKTVSGVVENHVRFGILLVDSPNKVEHTIYEIRNEIVDDQASKEERSTVEVTLSIDRRLRPFMEVLLDLEWRTLPEHF